MATKQNVTIAASFGAERDVSFMVSFNAPFAVLHLLPGIQCHMRLTSFYCAACENQGDDRYAATERLCIRLRP